MGHTGLHRAESTEPRLAGYLQHPYLEYPVERDRVLVGRPNDLSADGIPRDGLDYPGQLVGADEDDVGVVCVAYDSGTGSINKALL